MLLSCLTRLAVNKRAPLPAFSSISFHLLYPILSSPRCQPTEGAELYQNSAIFKINAKVESWDESFLGCWVAEVIGFHFSSPHQQMLKYIHCCNTMATRSPANNTQTTPTFTSPLPKLLLLVSSSEILPASSNSGILLWLCFTKHLHGFW